MEQEILKKRSCDLARQAVNLSYIHIKDDLPVAESLDDELVVTSNAIAILTAAIIYIAIRDKAKMP